MKGYIYKIKAKHYDDFYIGSTIQEPRKRWNDHLYDFRKNKHSCKKLQSIFNSSGEKELEFDVILQVEVETRNELFDIEQKTIDYFLNLNMPIANTDLKIKYGGEPGFEKITNYKDYRIIRICYEYDNLIYPLASYFNIHVSSIEELVKNRTYLNYLDKYRQENLTEEEKEKLYLDFMKENIEKLNIRQVKGSLSTFQGILILCLTYLCNPIKKDLYKYAYTNPSEDLMRAYREKRKYTINALEIFEKMTFIERLKFIIEVLPKNTTIYKGKLSTPARVTVFYARYARKNKLKSRIDLSQELNIDTTIISNYSSDKPRNKNIIEIIKEYNSLSENELKEIYVLIDNNKQILPLKSGEKLEG